MRNNMEIRVEINGIVIEITIPDQSEESSPVLVQCSECGWTKEYPDAKKARRGLAGHQQHCPGPHEEQERLRRMMGFNQD